MTVLRKKKCKPVLLVAVFFVMCSGMVAQAAMMPRSQFSGRFHTSINTNSTVSVRSTLTASTTHFTEIMPTGKTAQFTVTPQRSTLFGWESASGRNINSSNRGGTSSLSWTNLSSGTYRLRFTASRQQNRHDVDINVSGTFGGG